MSKIVISTLTDDTAYATHGDSPRRVLIRGGDAHRRGVPPGGVRTEISDADAEFLSKHGIFMQHQERGFVKIESIARDPDVVAAKRVVR